MQEPCNMQMYKCPKKRLNGLTLNFYFAIPVSCRYKIHNIFILKLVMLSFQWSLYDIKG